MLAPAQSSERQRRINKRRERWKKVFGREPGEIKRISIITTREEAERAYYDILDDGGQHFKNVISIDGEFYNGEAESKFYEWNIKFRNYPIERYGNPNKNGPFVRILQVSTVSGYIWVYDFFKLQHFPETLEHLLCSVNGVKRIGFGYDSDRQALVNTEERLRSRLPKYLDADAGLTMQTLMNFYHKKGLYTDNLDRP